ncbi:hypothetical protein PDIDSM_574 [Penicillium digitatum]|nr:hypothetical protein PDIDSM_574 [Penicillium digitatum]
MPELDGLRYGGPIDGSSSPANQVQRQKIVVVGFGMVAISLIEKIIKHDTERKVDIVVIGEESHVAYNRVGLSTFFEHRKIEDLYLNPTEWYDSFEERAFDHHLNTRVTAINPTAKTVQTSTGTTIDYDILVLATGSDATLPTHTPGHDAKGVFVYRTISDLERLIVFAAQHKGETAVTVGGGLLGLEAAKAMTDLKTFGNVKLIDRNKWVLARQLDGDAGSLVTRKIRELGLDVVHQKRVKMVHTDEGKNVDGITFEDGERIDCCCICFAIGVQPRDELGRDIGIQCGERGGFVIDENLQTSIPDIYAVGDCASWENQIFGIVAPGIEMADVLAFNLTNPNKPPRSFNRPDLSTKLKLLGIDVASFGDFFADRDGPKFLPGRRPSIVPGLGGNHPRDEPPVKALIYKDPFSGVYKKYLFTGDGKFLLGGMMIGDTKDYLKLNQMVKLQKVLDIPPSQLILGAQNGGEENADDLNDSTQICSCHNVTKGDVVECVENVCSHIPYSRADLYGFVAIKQLKSFVDIMKTVGKNPESLGCELCKPAIASILSSLFNPHIMDKGFNDLQEINDKFLANIQRDGTFSVVPRIPGGEITADKLIAIGSVAKKYGLYCKITGAQRIDMFGAKKPDLLNVWTELVDAGMESGHAYAKALRAIKSCVGTTWCRFGVGDSVGMAIRLEERYKSIRAPHKFKGAVSGCVRECAEAQNKDFGLIATEGGFNIFVGGNGGAKPRHAELLVADLPAEMVIPIIDRYLIFYIRTADKLQRTARWIETLPGGIKYLKEVIVDDKLGLCADMERQMHELVDSYFCEWTETVKDPKRRKVFQQFANTDETVDTVEVVQERSQQRPTDWPKDTSERENFKGHKWSSVSWEPVIRADCFSDEPPRVSSANVKRGDTQLAVFKIKGKFYATQQMCPHKRAFVLSDGLVGDDDAGKYWLSCPYHKRNFELNGEQAGRCSNDESMSIATFPVEERDDGWVYIQLPPIKELDLILGTKKWKVRRGEAEDPFLKVDKQFKGMKGKKVLDGFLTRDPVQSAKSIDW